MCQTSTLRISANANLDCSLHSQQLVTSFLLAFLVVHVGMVIWAGFTRRVRAMITGVATEPEERT
jgi:hypothetical protein